MEQRLIELETRYMEQQALLEDLSQVLYAQERTLAAMAARIEQLEKKLAEAGDPGLVDARTQEKPPHY